MGEELDICTTKEEPNGSLVENMRYLLYIRVFIAVCAVLILIPGISVLAGWGNTLASGAMVFVLFRMVPASKRYQKAAVFYGIVLAASLIGKSILSLLISISSLIAAYQEYAGHSEITALWVPEVSGKWHSLFGMELVVGILGGVLSSALTALGIAAGFNTDMLVWIIVIPLTGVGLVVHLLYLSYMNKTIKGLME